MVPMAIASLGSVYSHTVDHAVEPRSDQEPAAPQKSKRVATPNRRGGFVK